MKMGSIINKFRMQSDRVIFVTVSAKFLFGVGLGALLASHFSGHDWGFYGWVLLILALLLHIPAAYKILK